MSRNISESSIRKRLQKSLGPVPDPLWRYFVDKRYVEEFIQGLLEFEKLEEELRQLLEVSSSRSEPLKTAGFFAGGRRPRRGKLISLRSQALSVLGAAEARQREDVKSFRNEVLSGKLLQRDQVADWIKSLQQSDPPFRNSIVVELPLGTQVKFSRGGFYFEPPMRSIDTDQIKVVQLGPKELLDYSVAGDD